MSQPVMPLSDDEKRLMVRQFERLRTGIDEGLAEDDLAQRAIAFQQAYRGDARPLVDDFGAADDRRQWAERVRDALAGEVAPEFWPAPASAVAVDDAAMRDTSAGLPTDGADDMAVAEAVCEHCGTAFTVQCAPLPGHVVVTEHQLTCPACGRLTTVSLPGALVDSVAVDPS